MKKQDIAILTTFANKIHNECKIDKSMALILLEKSIISREIFNINSTDILSWYENRFKPNIFIIEQNDYLKVCVSALKAQFNLASSDFGTTRQRDLGQKWSDTIRGYIGEFGFQKFLKQRWDIESELGHEEGDIADYLDLDIHAIKKSGQTEFNKPKINISIKSTKFNGIWHDIPGDQFSHSDIHALVKIGVDTNHLFSFFKSISVFKDKILKCGTDNNCISQEEADNIYAKIPSFQPIIGYVCGFAVGGADKYGKFSYAGKKGKKNYTIDTWKGAYSKTDIEEIKQRENIIGSVKFEGIGEFSNENRFIFNTGSLLWSKTDWEELVINKL